MSHKPDQRALELAHVGTDILSHVERHISGQRYFLLLRLLLQDGNLGLKVRRLDVGDQSPLKPAAQPVFDLGQFFWRPVAGDHDLLHRFV